MDKQNYDWSSFSVRININAPAAKLYDAWATRAGMEYWFLRLSEFKKPNGNLRASNERIQRGDTYKWLWHGYADDTAEYGEIFEADGKDILSFRFGKAGDCQVRFFEEEGEMIVELVQKNISTDERGKEYFHIGCKTGWTFYLANMKSMYEGGIDLRNRNAKLKNMVNS